MSELGLIVSGASILGLSKAKKEYESAKAEYDRVSKIADAAEAAQLADINQYNATKYDTLEHFGSMDLDENGNPYDINAPIKDVVLTPILGLYEYAVNYSKPYKDYLQSVCFRFTNTGDRTITIESIYAKGFVYDEVYISFGEALREEISFDRRNNEFNPFIIPPHSTVDFIYGINYKDLGIEKIIANRGVKVRLYELDKKYFEDIVKILYQAHLKATGSSGNIDSFTFDEIVNNLPVGTIIKSISNQDVNKILFRASLDMIYHDSMDKNQRRALYEDIPGSVIWFGRTGGSEKSEFDIENTYLNSYAQKKLENIE